MENSQLNGSIKNPDIHLLQVEGIKGALPFILENKKLDITMYKDSLGRFNNSMVVKKMILPKLYESCTLNLEMERCTKKINIVKHKQKRDTLFLKEYIVKDRNFEKIITS